MGAPSRGGADTIVSRLELSPQGLGLEEACELLLLVEPGVQGLAHGGVARGWKALMGGAPVQIAIEALDEVLRPVSLWRGGTPPRNTAAPGVRVKQAGVYSTWRPRRPETPETTPSPHQ